MRSFIFPVVFSHRPPELLEDAERLGVVGGLGEQLGGVGLEVDRDAQGQAVAVLEPGGIDYAQE
jgi:hypothetical protein